MKLTIIIFSAIIAFGSSKSIAQTTFESKRMVAKKIFSQKISDIDDGFMISLQNIESPFEGNKSYRYYLQELKKEIEKKYGGRKPVINARRMASEGVDTPAVELSLEGNKYNYSVPNDNTLAVSNSGIIVSAINTNLIFYDTKTDSLLKTVKLNKFSDTLTAVSRHQYDPKVIYDYEKDRFIVVNLAGASSNNTTHVIVAFQQDADVMGEWSFYAIDGNPLNDTSWTDFPAIALTGDELFITGNLLRYGGSWQTSFKQSVIWQVDKNQGFSGDTAIDVGVYSGIKHNGVTIRNIHPVMGGSKFFGPQMYFMSNRNFAVQSDTFYLIKTDNRLAGPQNLTVRMIKSDKMYGAPPNPRMPGNKRLATNDARVLGAVLENGVLQFVGNTVDTLTGFATVYHGLIYDPDTATVAKLTLLKSDSLQFGYPNISYCGTTTESMHSIITFDYTSDSIFPGFAAVFFEKENKYSDIKILKEGETYMNVLMGSLQRWGDYSGSQPDYGSPGKVWVCGTYGKRNGYQRIYGTWINRLSSTVADPPVPQPVTGVAKVYPNPSTGDDVYFEFALKEDAGVTVEVVDMKGTVITLMKNYKAAKGKNVIHFYTTPLRVGNYVLRITTTTGEVMTRKFIVVN
jgi:hypothetical protein